MVATKTLNPLPFEHLEPKRFEDLVRQLLYDFRNWRTLEATGRSGADDGFDARAIEAGSAVALSEDERDERDEPLIEVTNDLVWLIQCKREKEIGPTRIIAHLDAIASESIEGLYGLIFAAACDFSKATRDACLGWCRHRGIQEVHIWGRAEIEDQLFQPKNDNLLFAYFGISLQIRRQSVATKVRRRITLKRRIRKMQEDAYWPGKAIVLRDPADDRYPYIDREPWDRDDYRWRAAWSLGVGVSGLKFIIRQHYAYYDHTTGEWDFATAFNHIYPGEAQDLWSAPSKYGVSDDIVHLWSGMPRQNQVHFRVVGTLPFEEIIEIDPEPDDYCPLSTVFTTFVPKETGGFEPPIEGGVFITLEGTGGWSTTWTPEKHVRVFPDSMRDTKWEKWLSSVGKFRPSRKRITPPVDPEIERIRREYGGRSNSVEKDGAG